MLIYLFANTDIQLWIYTIGHENNNFNMEIAKKGKSDSPRDSQVNDNNSESKRKQRQHASLVQTSDKSYADLLKTIKVSVDP